MSPPLTHTRILASAGSGKTYQLTNRFLRLLLAEVPPERILALTFTRMAAGEFFDAILNKLADASADPERGARLAKELGLDSTPPWEELLATLLKKMGHLRLGTLDGFFHDMLSAFSVEFGMGPSFRLMEDAEASLNRLQLFREFFQRKGIREEDRHYFAEAFKQATFGEDQKSLVFSLERFVEAQHSLYLAVPEKEAWGNRNRIWPDQGGPWKQAIDRTRAVREIKRALDPQLPEGRARTGWWKFLDTAETWEPGTDLNKTIPQAIENARESLEGGQAELIYNRIPVSLEGEPARLLIGLMDTLYHLELERNLQRTRGVFSVMEAYEGHYHRLIRRQGHLTFEDIQLLLAGVGNEAPLTFSQGMGPADDVSTLDIQFRMDGRFDHWLLDEFQDTSRLQWSILENLVDEVVMDPEGRRTFFFVGDVKQAIYGWRGGDAGLFDAVSARYRADQEDSPMDTLYLEQSWRSGPEVIALVNQVFGNPEVLRRIFSRTPGAVDRWSGLWRDHSSARQDHAGFAGHIQVEDETARVEAVHALLSRLQPQERGFTCALLVQTNDQVRDWVRRLRARGGFPVVEERNVSIASDNALGALLCSLIQAAAHPVDTFAWEHLVMSPLRIVFQEEGWDYSQFQTVVFDLLAEGGFENVLKFWIQKIYPETIPDAFISRRAEQLLEAARQFDRSGSRDPDAFRITLEGHRVRGGDATAGVRVMTIHQSKGLGFDVVLLPELERRGNLSLDRIREGLGLSRDALGRPEWILDLPRGAVSDVDPTLRAFRQEQQEESAFESQCLFYVGLTRAKRGLYCITEVQKKVSETPTYLSWLNLALEGGSPRPFMENEAYSATWSRGREDWFLDHQETGTSDEAPPQVGIFPGTPGLLRDVNPSRGDWESHIPRFRDTAKQQSGTWVHRAFEQVAWWNEAVPGELEAWADSRKPDDRAPAHQAVQTVLQCLNREEIRQYFQQEPGVEIYREQPFDLVDDNIRISGQWDRVQRYGKTRAVLIDFKSGADESTILSEAVRRQLRLYRKAASLAFNLPEASIQTCLLLYRKQEVLSVDLNE